MELKFLLAGVVVVAKVVVTVMEEVELVIKDAIDVFADSAEAKGTDGRQVGTGA